MARKRWIAKTQMQLPFDMPPRGKVPLTQFDPHRHVVAELDKRTIPRRHLNEAFLRCLESMFRRGPEPRL